MQQLEAELGVALLDRTKRPFVVTPEGQAFYEACRGLLESWEKAKAEIAAVKARVDGTVRVAAIYSVGLHDVSRNMQRFMSLYPEARVQLECLHPHKVVEAVVQGEADVGIMSYPPADRTLAIVPLRSEPMAFVCHPNHRLARRRVVTPADLNGETFVAFDAGLTIRKAIDRALRQHNVKVNTVMEFDNIETIKQAIIIAAGVCDPPAPHRAERGLDPYADRRPAHHYGPCPPGGADSPPPEAAHADGEPVHPAPEGRQRGADSRRRGGGRPCRCRAPAEALGSGREVVMSGEFEDEYSATIDDDLSGPEVLGEAGGALATDTIAVLSPAEPICLSDSATVHEAVQIMLARRQAGVLVTDGAGRLVGIFTERDVLTRVVGKDLDARRTPLAAVMTRNPEALTARDRVAYAVHCMSVAGYRTIPLVDPEGRPIGVVTVSDVVRWLANLFPEAVLNLRPGDAIKHPQDVDAG